MPIHASALCLGATGAIAAAAHVAPEVYVQMYHAFREGDLAQARTPGTPIELRQRMMTRFAGEVCPRYSTAMRRTKAA